MTTWQEAARGIPVWEGCRTTTGHVVIAPTHGGRGAYVVGWAGDRFHSDMLADAVPDLSDPDTCAAYLRRLAVALGCPEEVANGGVLFYREPRSAWWTVGAGEPSDVDVPHSWSRDVCPNEGDRLTALAKAYPNDARHRVAG